MSFTCFVAEWSFSVSEPWVFEHVHSFLFPFCCFFLALNSGSFNFRYVWAFATTGVEAMKLLLFHRIWKYSSNREIASGVGNMSGIRFVLSSRELGLCSPPALQELCLHCCSEVVTFSRESCWVLDEAKMEWFRVGKNRWRLFFNSILQKLNLFQNWKLSNRSFWFSFFLILLD